MITTVLKVGGSLGRGEKLTPLCQQLAELGEQHQLLVIPGGGDFADVVRGYDERYYLDDTTAHWMAVLGMDQYGYLLTDQITGSAPVRSLAEAGEVALAGRVPVLLPFESLRKADPLPHSWEVTSDSIAAWVAAEVGVPRLVLLKSIDGLHTAGLSDRLLEEVTLEQLAYCAEVDPYLPLFLSANHLEVWIVNGQKPERVAELLAKGWTIGTKVCPATP